VSSALLSGTVLRWRWGAIATLGVAAGALAVPACSDEPGTSADAGSDRRLEASSLDAPFEAFVPDEPRVPPMLPSCLGDALPFLRSGEKSYVNVAMSPAEGGTPDGAPWVQSTGAFVVDFGSNGSSIDFGGFKGSVPPTPLSCNGDPKLPGASCAFPYFDFFGTWGTVYLSTADFSAIFSSIRQAGIVGTDFLSAFPVTMDHVARQLLRGSTSAFCTDPQLIAAGFVPLPTAGFYVHDTSKLRPLSDVVTTPDAGVQNFVVPNVPTVPIAVGGVNALAQLDTGFDDRLQRHSLNVNKAFLAALLQKDSDMLVRSEADDIFLTTCVDGFSQKAEAWILRKGTPVDFLSDGGVVGRRDFGNVVYVKDAPPEVKACGGIGTWTVPAAQVGASFMVDAYAVVFDPMTSRVWMPK
jgi:hypothetical protein